MGRSTRLAGGALEALRPAADAGGLLLTADLPLRSDPGGISIVVRDTGAGIDPACLPYVFYRFRQGDGSASRQHGGLGLGLAIVRHLTFAVRVPGPLTMAPPMSA